MAIPYLIMLWMPTTLMSLFISPNILKNVAVTGAVVETDHDVLELMQKESMQNGDYSAASEASRHTHSLHATLPRDSDPIQHHPV